MAMHLKNSIALITGGAQGLGKGFARALLEAGGKVSLLDVREDIGQTAAKDFNSQFGSNSALFIRCDVRKQQEVCDAFKKTVDVFGKLDLVVNNAGVSTLKPTDWERTIDIDLTAVMRCCLIASEYLSKHGGHIINISSAAGLTPIPFDPAYVASKHGVVGLSRSLAGMWESQSICVNCLCPSFVDTELVRSVMEQGDNTVKMAITTLGIMSVDKVVDAFKKLLQLKDETGGVLAVTPIKVDYKFKPRAIRPSAKL